MECLHCDLRAWGMHLLKISKDISSISDVDEKLSVRARDVICVYSPWYVTIPVIPLSRSPLQYTGIGSFCGCCLPGKYAVLQDFFQESVTRYLLEGHELQGSIEQYRD